MQLRTTRVLAGAATAFAAPILVLAASPVAAEPVTYSCVEEFPSLAEGCFESYGDHVVVEDRETDGRAAQVRWKTDYGRSGVCAVPSGKASVDCNYDFRENALVTFRLELVKSGSVVKKSTWHARRA